MNLEYFITKRIAFSKGKGFSSFIIKIAITAVALSMAVMIVTTATVNGFQNEISKKIYGFWGHIHVNPVKSVRAYEDITPISRNQNFLPVLDTLKGIHHVQAYARKAGIMKTDKEIEGIMLKGVGSDFNWDFFKQYMVEGEAFQVTDSTKANSIVISEITAKRLSLKVGDKIMIYFVQEPLRRRRPLVTGIYKTGLAEYDEKFALMDIGHLQKLNDWEKEQIGGFEIFLDKEEKYNPLRALFSGMSFYIMDYMGTIATNWLYEWHIKYNTPFVDLTPPDIIKDMTEEIHYMIPNSLNARTIKENHSNIFEWLQLQDINRLVILALVAAVAIINMITVLLILILERTNMIGIIKALGASNWSIRKIFLYNATFIVGLGLILGNVLGIGICWLQQKFGFIRLPEESYYINIAPVDIDLWVILGLNLGVLLVCIFTLIIPSYLVSRIDPIKAIRFK